MAAHNKETRDKIAAAARQLIVEQGFAAASILAIRGTAGLANGSFYCAFKNRDALIDHLLEQIAESRRHGLTVAARTSAGEAKTALQGIVRVHLRWLAEHPSLARLRDRLMPGLAVENKVRHAAAMAWEIDLLAAWARPLIADGTIRTLPDRLLHALILGNADAVGREWNTGNPPDLDLTITALGDAAWAAIRTRSKQAKGKAALPVGSKSGQVQKTPPEPGGLGDDLFARRQ